jgi:UDP-N-acetylglucosamine transferase subunit ALG13
VIFATCGSSHFPFDRMMDSLAALADEDLYVQHGPATPPPHARCVSFLPFDEIVRNIEEADIVISHAGVGSILCATQAGHTPVIFPRLKRYKETVDDHQTELASALEERGRAIIVWDPKDLPSAVASVPPRRVHDAGSSRAFVDAVRAAISS